MAVSLQCRLKGDKLAPLSTLHTAGQESGWAGFRHPTSFPLKWQPLSLGLPPRRPQCSCIYISWLVYKTHSAAFIDLSGKPRRALLAGSGLGQAAYLSGWGACWPSKLPGLTLSGGSKQVGQAGRWCRTHRFNAQSSACHEECHL